MVEGTKGKASARTTAENADEFASRIGERAPAFMFEKKGAKLIGKLAEITSGFDPKYMQASYPILIVEDEAQDGARVSVHCFHKALLSQLDRANPMEGERIGIVYNGEKTPKSGGDAYRDYSVNVDRASSAPRSFRDATPRVGGEDDPSQEALPFD